MEIKWLGHACFAITYKGFTVVIDLSLIHI